jgi:hypothetical protein
MASVMLWRLLDRDDPTTKAAEFRRTHERWLTSALRSRAPIPRIPIRRVDDGGFDDLLSRPRGRDVAARWWRMAFARVPDGD